MPGILTEPPNSLAEPPLIQLRPWAVEPFWRSELRTAVWVWARQKTKSSTAAARALYRGMIVPGLTSVFASASVLLGAEFVRKEAWNWQRVIIGMRKAAESQNLLLQSNADGLDIDAVCDLFESSKLEARIHHDRTTVSRSVVVAPNPDTAVGWTGDIYLDEFGRIPDFQAVLEAVLPFMTSNPDFRLLMTSTPPPDDGHYSYELTMPPVEEFPVNPKGNWYRSQAGFICHRVDAYDAAAAGIPIYDDMTGEPITPEEHRLRSFDKRAWDRNHGVLFLRGGTAALTLATLHHAMERGREECVALDISEEIEL